MSWNIKTPGDYINGPLTVAGVAQFNSNVGIAVSPTERLDIQTTSGRFKVRALGGVSVKIDSSGAMGYNVSTGNAHLFQINDVDVATLNATGLAVGSGFTPSYKLHVGQSQVGETNIFVDNQQNDPAALSGIWLSAYGGTWKISVPRSATFVNPLIFKFGTTEMARLTSVGAFVMAGGNTAANGVGIAFPAAQSASTDANTLDDYEEGTWTIGLAFGGLSTGITASANQGKYVKVGRKVTVTGYLGLTNKGSATGDATITGLPFPIGNSTENYSTASLWFSAVTPTAGGSANQGVGIGNTSVINLSTYKTDGFYSNLTSSNFANNSEICLSFTYFV